MTSELSGFVCNFHPATLLSIYIWIVSCGKNENKQKRARDWPILKTKDYIIWHRAMDNRIRHWTNLAEWKVLPPEVPNWKFRFGPLFDSAARSRARTAHCTRRSTCPSSSTETSSLEMNSRAKKVKINWFLSKNFTKWIWMVFLKMANPRPLFHYFHFSHFYRIPDNPQQFML